MAHLSRSTLEERFAQLPPAPQDAGEVVLVVARPDTDERQTPARVPLTASSGVDGDRWSRRDNPNPRNQITVMRADVAELIADGQPLTLFGDNLLVRLDIGDGNLPPGTRLRIGTALCEVTPHPHTGCGKFEARFGKEARDWANSPEYLRHRLRGIHVCVVEDGEAGPGDAVAVVSRPAV